MENLIFNYYLNSYYTFNKFFIILISYYFINLIFFLILHNIQLFLFFLESQTLYYLYFNNNLFNICDEFI